MSVKINSNAIAQLIAKTEDLVDSAFDINAGCEIIVKSLGAGGTLFLAGNGGSMADALHIAGELKKSFEIDRNLDSKLSENLLKFRYGKELSENLQAGLKVTVLGSDPVLATAIDNDIKLRHIQFAQELLALGRSGDAILSLSTSGKSRNIIYAFTVAKALQMSTILLTGLEPSNEMLEVTDCNIRVPATKTADVQGYHSLVYHCMCRVIEDSFYPKDL